MTDSVETSPSGETVGGETLPTAWFGSGQEQALEEKLAAASKHVLLLDYDGTLAPFRADKMQALPYPGVTEILQQLNELPGTRVVLVTGRRAGDLADLFSLAKHLEIWGSHGREHISRSREYTFYPPTAEQSTALAKLNREIETALCDLSLKLSSDNLSISSHGELTSLEAPEPLEKKPGSLAVHWRGLAGESQEALRNCVEEAYRQHGDATVERLPFESGVEFRAAGYTKAYPVTRELEQSGEDTAIAYLGDDLTDEDAFRALGNRGESLLVRPEIRPSYARYWLKPPEDLLRFLRVWQQPGDLHG